MRLVGSLKRPHLCLFLLIHSSPFAVMGDPRPFPREKSSGASPKLAEDSDDDFMPDKLGNLPWQKKTGNSAASVSSKKKKSSDASAKLAEDSDDDFMPDKHGNLPWKKKTSNSDASASSKKKKSSDASAKPAEDSDDDFMPDKHGNLPWKKKC